jgi:putative oxidoreductase
MLVLRLWLGLTMLLNHGLEKVLKYSDMSGSFPDPLGVGSTASLVLAILGEAVGSALLVLGFFTRPAALSLVVTMGVACLLVHGGSLSGEKSGELAFIYLAGFLAILIAGPGRFSLDQLLFAGKRGTKA